MGRRSPSQLPEYVPHASAPPDGDDLLGRLIFGHRQIEGLWSELQLAHRRHLNQHELGRRVVRSLAEHDALELQLLYPAVARGIGDELADHARQDHEQIREMLDEVDGEDPADDLVFEAVTAIMGRVMAHIEEEEKITFPMLRAVLSDEELAALRSAPAPAAEPDAKAGRAGLGRRLLGRR